MRSRPNKKTKAMKRSLARSFVVTVAVGIPSALIANVGCSSTPTPDNNATPGTPPQGQGPGVATGKCTDEGAQQPCHFSMGLAAGGKVLSCFSGTQTCTGGTWSTCGGDGTVTNSVLGAGLDLAPASASTGGIHTLAVGPTTAMCGDGVCSPLKCSGGPDNNKTCTVPGVGTCAAGKTCGAAETCTNCPADCGLCPPGAPDAGAVICTSDPCNPNCQGWLNAPGISSTAGSAASVIGVSGFGQIPAGQIQKLLLDKTNTGTNCDNFSAPGLPSSYYNCQVDTYCQMSAMGGDGNCHQFGAGDVQGTDLQSMGAANAGMDVTIGPGCSNTESDKYRYFPICNRGTVPIPAGTIIRVKYFNPVQAFNPCPNTSCTAAAGYDCSMKVGDAVLKNGAATPGVDLLPGTCQLLDTQQAGMAPGGANCSQPNGEKWMYANCDGATTGVVEGDITMRPGAPPVGVTGAPTNEPITAPGISGCANNWTDHSPNNNPPSCGKAGQNVITLTTDYHAVCPTGTTVLWDKLSYDTTAASNASGSSEVFFEAATAPDVAGAPGAYSAFIEMAEATDDLFAGRKDPEKCSAIKPFVPPYVWPSCTNVGPGPAPPCCPKDIEDQFKRLAVNLPFGGADPGPGAILARQPWLRLQITIKATPDNKADTTLNNWQISYQCIASE